MIYPFKCYVCDFLETVHARPLKPPKAPTCPECHQRMHRVYGCQIDTSGCRDAGFIPDESRVVDVDRNYDKSTGLKKEAAFNRAINNRRKELANGGNKGSFRHTHSIPAELYHGKIKETGDKAYWDDPKNLSRHKNCKVD